jgi:hypothetical protein
VRALALGSGGAGSLPGADTWRGVDVKDGFGPGRGQGGVFPV